MHTQKLLVFIFLGLSLTVAADFRTITEVHEVNLIFLRLPGTPSGTLSFAECADCNSQTIRVSPATHYVINGRTVSLADFKRTVASITNRRDTDIDVFHHLESDTVTRVRVTL